MYKIVKQIAKKVLPSSLVENNKKTFRKAVSLFYRGQNFECNVCEIKLRRFIKLDNNDLLCPNCGSLPRTRILYKYLGNKLADNSILHFSPPKSLKNRILQTGNTKEYLTTDYENEFEADLALDIENIDQPNERFDVIICFHVLEHIKNDIQALRELNRIMRKGGICIVQTPFKKGEIYENSAITSPSERLKHFGQEDHLRIYSAEGLKNRMEEAGFKAEILEFKNEAGNRFGLKTRNVILLGKK